MSQDYKDARIEVSPGGLLIRWYYFPAGSKRIPFTAIQRITRADMGAVGGRGRIWGTGNFKYWMNLDTKRFGKRVAFIVDLGRAPRPFLTPDDPDAFERAITSHSGVTVEHGDSA